MTNLQIGIIIAGVLLIVAIYCLTKIQERKIQKREKALYQQDAHDALMDTPPVVFWDTAVDQQENEFSLADDEIPIFTESQLRYDASIADDLGVSALRSAIENKEPELAMPDELTPQFDYICGIVANTPVDGQTILEAMSELTLSKPVQWVGVSVGSLSWAEIDARKHYQYLCIGLQLADRKGALTAEELEVFLDFIQDFAYQVDALADIPNTDHLIERARAVDAFCAEVDIQIGVNVLSDTEKHFVGARIQSLAEASGCILADDGSFHRVDLTTANRLFILYNLDDQPFDLASIKALKTEAVGLIMDLPLVTDGVLVFNQMLLFARQLSETLGGRLVDVNQQPLTNTMIDKIRKQIVVYHSKMRQHGVTPGSRLAARLFR